MRSPRSIRNITIETLSLLSFLCLSATPAGAFHVVQSSSFVMRTAIVSLSEPHACRRLYRRQRDSTGSLPAGSVCRYSHHYYFRRYLSPLVIRRNQEKDFCTMRTVMATSESNSNSNNNMPLGHDHLGAHHETQGKDRKHISPVLPLQRDREHFRLGTEEQQSRMDFLRAAETLLGVLAAGAVGATAGRGTHAVRAIDLGGMEFGFGEDDTFEVPPEDNPDGLKSPRPLAYRVEFTDPPSTVPFPKKLEDQLVLELSKQQILFMGTHGDSAWDQLLAVKLIDRVSRALRRKMTIGLEQVERRFQSALDAYVAGGSEPLGDGKQADPSLDEADAKLAEVTEWERRSKYPFEAFLPIFHLARSRGLRLIALGLDSEDAFEVLQGGMDALGEDERNEYVSDFKGFVEYVRSKGFQAYTNQLIFPTYDRLVEQGLFGKEPPSRANFFSARILADEAVASKVVQSFVDNGNSPMIVLQPGDRVKYGFGASGRVSRIASSLGANIEVRTLMLNPTPDDSLSRTRALRLTLQYADDLYDGRPFANYLWFTKSPMANLIPHMFNPENKGWLESINLYDFRQAPPT